MKKLVMYFTGAVMAISLAACTPTEVPETSPQAVENVNPEGLTPEMMQETTAAEKLPDPDAPVLEMAFMYSVDDSGKLVREIIDLEELTEETLIQCLIERGVLEEGTEVNTFGIDGGEKAGPGVSADAVGDGERVGSLDLTKFPQVDAAKEQQLLNAIANTFIDNFELDKLKLLIEGENFTSANQTQGDEDYLDYSSEYTVIK